MADTNQETILAAVWIMMHQCRQPRSSANRAASVNDESRAAQQAIAPHQSQQMKIQLSGTDDCPPKETVKRLVSAYLHTPTHISFQFPCW
jgi:hypothetical protein